MVSRKKIILIVMFAMLAIVAVIVMVAQQRQRRDILMELVLLPSGRIGRGSRAYYFVINSNGTFTSYNGRSRINSCDNIRSGNPLIPILRRRERITLSEEEYQYIFELVDTITSGRAKGEISIQTRAILIHNGNIYGRVYMTGTLKDLLSTINRLTPLTIHW